MLQPETPQDRSFLRSGIWKTLALFTFPSNDLQDLASRLTSPLDFISPPEREVKWVQEMFFILNMVLFPHLLREFSMQSQCCIYKYVFFTEFDGITQHFLIWPKSILQNTIFLVAPWVWGFLLCFCFLRDKGETRWNLNQTQLWELLVSNRFGIRFVQRLLQSVFTDWCASWIRPLNSGCFFPKEAV